MIDFILGFLAGVECTLIVVLVVLLKWEKEKV